MSYEESMYKQRSKDIHINLGDGNAHYFYDLMKRRHSQYFISEIIDREGDIFSSPSVIQKVFLSHFQNILSSNLDVVNSDISHIIQNWQVLSEVVDILVRPISIREIEEAIRCDNPHKVPRRDGFNAHIFKVCQSIVGNDVCGAILDFSNMVCY